MDLLQGVKDMVDEESQEPRPVPKDIPLPSKEELLKMLEGMTGMSEQDKIELRSQLLGQTKGFGPRDVNPASSQMLILIGLLLVIAAIFGKISDNNALPQHLLRINRVLPPQNVLYLTSKIFRTPKIYLKYFLGTVTRVVRPQNAL